MRIRWLGPSSFLLFWCLVYPGLAIAQQQSVGVVTALKGKAQLTRAATQTALRFKDDLNLRDVIDTQEKSLTRVLFGGKSTVTVRELSRLEVREELLPGGTSRTVHDLSSGSILVNVARSLMRRGDEVQIRTPNAVAAVRGSTVFAQYNAALAQSVFVLLTGSVIVTPQGQPSITLTPNTSVNVTGTAGTGVQADPVVTVTQAEANAIVEGSEVGTGGVTEESAEAGVVEATQLAEAVVAAVAEPVVTTIAESPPGEAIDETPVVDVTSDDPAPSTGEGTVSKEAAAARVLPFTFKTDITSSDTPFLQVTDATVNKTVDLITVNSGVTATLGGTLVFIDPSTITTTGSLLRITGANLIVGGSLFSSENSTITADTLFDISNGSTVTNTVGPVIKIVGGSLTADSLFDIDESGNTFNFTGTLLDLKDTTVTLRILEDDPLSTPDVDDFNLTVAANEPLFRVDNSTLKLTGTTNKEELIFIGGEDFSGRTFKGVGLIAKNSSTISNKGGGLLDIEGTLTTTSTDALVQISGSTVETFTDAMFEVEPPPSGSTSVNMTGPLVSIAGTTSEVTTDNDFFLIRGSSTLTSQTTSPFINVTDATVTVGSGSTDFHFFKVDSGGTQFTTTNTGTGALVLLSNTTLNQGGTNLTLFKATGTGTSFQPIKGSQDSFEVNSKTANNPIGALFKATNESNITVDTAFKLDNALFEATLPVFELVSTSSTQTQITSEGTFANIGGTTKSVVLLTGPFIKLTKGLITVNDGPLLSIKNGSTMDVLGDLLQLSLGSKINVVSSGTKAAIEVSGSGSALNVTGALINFLETSGNTLVVDNNVTGFTTLPSGITIKQGTANSINIGPAPIISAGSAGKASNIVTISGAVIQTGTSGGTVDITAATP